MANWVDDNELNEWSEEPDWDEDRWEEFFQEQDRRADYYLHKLEQSLKKYEDAGAPNAVEKAVNDLFPDIEIPAESESVNPIDQLLNEPESPADEQLWNDDELEEDFDDFEKIYAYQIAYEFATSVSHFVKPLFKSSLNNLALQLHYHGYQVAAHIVGGHSFGYERDGITANIAKCKRALKSINACIESILTIRQNKDVVGVKSDLISPVYIDSLFQQAIKVRDAIILRIEELRHMVWW